MKLQPGKIYKLNIDVTLYSESSISLNTPTARYSSGKYIRFIDKGTEVMLLEYSNEYIWHDCKLLTLDGITGWIFTRDESIYSLFTEV